MALKEIGGMLVNPSNVQAVYVDSEAKKLQVITTGGQGTFPYTGDKLGLDRQFSHLELVGENLFVDPQAVTAIINNPHMGSIGRTEMTFENGSNLSINHRDFASDRTLPGMVVLKSNHHTSPYITSVRPEAIRAIAKHSGPERSYMHLGKAGAFTVDNTAVEILDKAGAPLVEIKDTDSNTWHVNPAQVSYAKTGNPTELQLQDEQRAVHTNSPVQELINVALESTKFRSSVRKSQLQTSGNEAHHGHA